ncbi:MAG: 3-deoxy-D-manno-octulosonic acid transferase [Bacteroidia bacterium]|nr:MAG: 3-deoxy-D-manno-octulosonic acid transferase [Bacteroidia bacterium]
MRFLYELGICLYGMLLRLAALWHPKAAQMVRGRRGWRGALGRAMQGREGRVVWFHCASLGEFEQGRPIMEAFMQQHPDWRLVVTFFSPSGYNVRRDYELAEAVLYLPLDTARNAREFVELLSPSCAFFVKYEIWRNLLMALERRGVPTFLVSARFRHDQLFFRPYGGWYRRLLSCFTRIFVQDDDSWELLRGLGLAERVTISGDSRFDRVVAAARRTASLPALEAFAAGHELLIAGSTWPPDEEHLLPLAQSLPAGWKLVVAPHEIDGARIDGWLARAGGGLRYTQLTDNSPLATGRILVVDTVGILLSVYQYGDLAYIGGGFGVGIHNTLEAAACSIPVLFGPRYEQFLEADDLIEEGAALAIHSGEELRRAALGLMGDGARRRTMGARAGEYVEGNTGASGLVVHDVEKILEQHAV